MGHEWDDDRPPFARLRWRWLRWRARHYALKADLLYHEHPCPETEAVAARAAELVARLELARP